MVLAKIRTIVIAVVLSQDSAHIELAFINVIFGVQRNNRVPFAVHKFATGFITISRPCAVADPFIKRSRAVLATYCRVIDCHAIACSVVMDLVRSIPTCPVLQIQATISFHSICYGILHPATSADEQAKHICLIGINGCARKVDGVVVDNPMAAGCVYEAAEFLGIICGYGSAACLESIRAVAGVFAVIPDGDNSIAPAIAQKTASTVLRVAVLANGHVE